MVNCTFLEASKALNGRTHIARFDGTEWVDVGGGVTAMDFLVIDLLTYKNELYASGKFEMINEEKFGNSIARWDGSQWIEVGGGMADVTTVYGMTIWQNKLVVLGAPSVLTGMNHLSFWNGDEWCSRMPSMDQWITASINTVVSYQDTLYVGGGYTYFDDDDLPVSIISKFKGNSADWDTCALSSVGITLLDQTKEQMLSVYPNPETDYVTIEIATGFFSSLTVFNAHGEEVLNTNLTEQLTHLDTSQWSNGLYFLVVRAENQLLSARIIKK